MKKGWQTRALGEICNVVGGGTPPKDKSEFYSGNIPWATVRDMKQDVITETEFKITNDAVKTSSTNVIPSGNVVIATRVGLGKVCILGQDTAINQDLRGIIPLNSQTLNVRYLYWWFKTISDAIIAEGTGATVQGVKLPFIKSLQIPVPPLDEQSRITNLLDKTFAGLAKAKENAEKNLQNARALFESYLDAVLSCGTQGWPKKRLGDVCEFIGGSQPPKAVFQKTKTTDSVRLIQIRDYKSDKHIVYIPQKQARRFCKADDIMIGRYGPPIFQILRGLEGAYNVALMKALPDEKQVSRDFLFHFLKNPSILNYVIYHSERAAGQIGVTKETLEPYPISVPSLSEQKKITEKLEVLESETQSLTRLYDQKREALDSLKKSILHEAFSGNL